MNKIFSDNIVKSIMNNLENEKWNVEVKENRISANYFTDEMVIGEYFLIDYYIQKDEILNKIFFDYAKDNNFKIVKNNVMVEDEDSITYISEIEKDNLKIRYSYYYNGDSDDCIFTFELV